MEDMSMLMYTTTKEKTESTKKQQSHLTGFHS